MTTKEQIKRFAIPAVIVFLLAIAYSFIDSKIDRSNQQAILQEKQSLESLSRKPLENCVEYAKSTTEWKKSTVRALWEGEMESCYGVSKFPCKIKRSKEAINADMSNSIDQIEKELSSKLDECYKRFK